jgi:hypothetical protein
VSGLYHIIRWNVDVSIKVEPVVDRDTIGVPGSPDIAATILQKIDSCDVFVCDVSIINGGQATRSTPNPNVLFELGYAVKRLGWDRIILVLNSSFGPVQDLPFDLRMKRVLVYSAQNGTQDKASEHRILQSQLNTALQAIFRQVDNVDEETSEQSSQMIDGSRTAKNTLLTAKERTTSERVEIVGGVWREYPSSPGRPVRWNPRDHITIGQMEEHRFELCVPNERGIPQAVAIPYSFVQEAWVSASGGLMLLLTIRIMIHNDKITLEPNV